MQSDNEVIDVGIQHVANVYAKAFIGVGEKSGTTEQRLEELDALIDEVLDQFPAFEETLVSGLVSDEDKRGILSRVLTGRTSTELLNFLQVVTTHGRLNCLRAIRRAIHLRVDELRGRREVELRYATEVDESVTREITAEIQKRLGILPKVTVMTDPTLLGGVVIKIGDTVCDGSLATQLQSMRNGMVSQTVQKIQAGRKRFENGTQTN